MLDTYPTGPHSGSLAPLWRGIERHELLENPVVREWDHGAAASAVIP
jgi:hypothetical protein